MVIFRTPGESGVAVENQRRLLQPGGAVERVSSRARNIALEQVRAGGVADAHKGDAD